MCRIDTAGGAAGMMRVWVGDVSAAGTSRTPSPTGYDGLDRDVSAAGRPMTAPTISGGVWVGDVSAAGTPRWRPLRGAESLGANY